MTVYEEAMLTRMVKAIESQEKTSKKILWEITHIRELLVKQDAEERRGVGE